MRRAVLCAAAVLIGSSASAQTRVFVSGAAFGEFKQMTGQGTFVDADNSSFGGGVRVGALFGDQWSLELGVDVGGETSQNPIYYALAAGILEDLQSLYPDLPPRTSIVPSFEETSRLTTVSTLLAYHPRVSGRYRPGFGAGLTFIRESQRTRGGFVSPFIYPPQDYQFVRYGPAATLIAEVAIDLTERLAVVPEMRVHTYGSQIVLRPGAAIRFELGH